jgi:hypothetical protein
MCKEGYVAPQLHFSPVSEYNIVSQTQFVDFRDGFCMKTLYKLEIRRDDVQSQCPYESQISVMLFVNGLWTL